MTAAKPAGGLARLREPFDAHQISKLPKQMRKDDQDKGKCERGSRYSADGHFCGGWHARSLHLDYAGHAAVTDRLLDADPEWSWEPVAFGPDGLPAFDKNGGLWIRLTVCGVTRLGYGDAQGKTGPNAVKEAIGDALRNAGMRFGAALDLWHKGELHAADEERGAQPTQAPAGRSEDRPAASRAQLPPIPAPDPQILEVKRQIVAAADRLGISVADLNADFVERLPGCGTLAEADLPTLGDYLGLLAAADEEAGAA